MTYSAKTKFIIFAIAAVILTVAGYFYFFQKPTENNPSVSTQPKSLADNPNYVKEKMDEFLADNPKATEEYARDIVYHDIAVKEKDTRVCDKIKDDYWKEHCYRLLR